MSLAKPHTHNWSPIAVSPVSSFAHGEDTALACSCECGETTTLWLTGAWTLEEIRRRVAAK